MRRASLALLGGLLAVSIASCAPAMMGPPMTGTAVSIQDFSFTPGSLVVTAGQTVTFTNNGMASHSATADDGSFDTGVLAGGGQKASVTFTKVGTFAYFCKIHPGMKATIMVMAANSAP